ncbi:class I SAM-dependent methyltransferase [Castellaniella sp. GW247-6E4]|uniref:class I SAM-dependent methyltransferase n=1 Tax=Castellaniella sp. GW247-6E4 TaxID=3140380 RepID=UPI00331588B0
MTPKPFSDHFKDVARQYAESRPGYPAALFDWLAAQCADRACAWDCGAGSGQASVMLARDFRRVIATDASPTQIAQARAHERVEYRVAPAEASGLPDQSVDLVAVAQALHWFDLEAFYREVRRVARPDGVFAAWTYGVMMVEGDAVDRLLRAYYHETVGPWWPAERRHVETGYRDLPFPFQPLEAPPLFLQATWDLDQMLGYLRSWSATARFMAARGFDPVAELTVGLAPAWGGAHRQRLVHWPMAVRAGRVA